MNLFILFVIFKIIYQKIRKKNANVQRYVVEQYEAAKYKKTKDVFAFPRRRQKTAVSAMVLAEKGYIVSIPDLPMQISSREPTWL